MKSTAPSSSALNTLRSLDFDETTITATGDLMVHGVTKSVTVALQAQRQRATIQVSGAIEISFADFGVTAPSVGPANTVDDHGTIEFLLTLQRP